MIFVLWSFLHQKIFRQDRGNFKFYRDGIMRFQILLYSLKSFETNILRVSYPR